MSNSFLLQCTAFVLWALHPCQELSHSCGVVALLSPGRYHGHRCNIVHCQPPGAESLHVMHQAQTDTDTAKGHTVTDTHHWEQWGPSSTACCQPWGSGRRGSYACRRRRCGPGGTCWWACGCSFVGSCSCRQQPACPGASPPLSASPTGRWIRLLQSTGDGGKNVYMNACTPARTRTIVLYMMKTNLITVNASYIYTSLAFSWLTFS